MRQRVYIVYCVDMEAVGNCTAAADSYAQSID